MKLYPLVQRRETLMSTGPSSFRLANKSGDKSRRLLFDCVGRLIRPRGKWSPVWLEMQSDRPLSLWAEYEIHQFVARLTQCPARSRRIALRPSASHCVSFSAGFFVLLALGGPQWARGVQNGTFRGNFHSGALRCAADHNEKGVRNGELNSQ